jgi:hypothetical protein
MFRKDGIEMQEGLKEDRGRMEGRKDVQEGKKDILEGRNEVQGRTERSSRKDGKKFRE